MKQKKREKIAKALADLESVVHSDSEVQHGKADEVLLRFAPREVRETYEALRKFGDWHSA